MQGLPKTLPTNVKELQKLLLEQQRVIEQHEKSLALRDSQLKKLEEKLRLLNVKHFAKSSEKNPGQGEFQFLNEAEVLLAKQALEDAALEEQNEDEPDIDVPAHKRKRRKKRELPSDLPRCTLSVKRRWNSWLSYRSNITSSCITSLNTRAAAKAACVQLPCPYNRYQAVKPARRYWLT